MTVLLAHRLPGTSTEAAADELRERLDGAEILAASDESEFRSLLEDAEVLVTGTPPGDAVESAPNLRWVQALSSGTDQYDEVALADRGIALTNASGVHGPQIGQQVLGYLIYFERGFDRAVTQQHERTWDRYGGGELGDRTIGIVGAGAIGSKVADYCTAFDPELLSVKRDPSTAPTVFDAVYPPAELETVLERSDYLVIACPLTDETRRLVDADAIATLPDDAVLVNIARGEIVDEAALVTALDDGRLGGAALDVFETEPLPEESPLWGMDNVLVTPHTAGTTPHYWRRCVELVERNHARYRAGKPLENRIV